MILACHNLTKSFGEHLIVKQGSFHIEAREKAALVGINGAGKTTILKIIIGEEVADDGEVILRKGKTIGYLAQQQKLQSGNTIYEEIKTAKQDVILLEQQIRHVEQELNSLSAEAQAERLNTYHRLVAEFELKDGYAYKSEITGVLKGLGFPEDDFKKQTDTLSGGQKTRVALGKLLLTKPDVLLLDEPTNHLDLNSIAWLESYLINYSGAVLIVSHDRYFLNKVVTKIVEVEHTVIRTYSGNYKEYAQKKQAFRDAQLKEYLNQQQEIKRQEAVIEKLKQFNREKSIKRAESREKALDKIVRIEKPLEVTKEMHFRLEPNITSGNDVLTVEELAKSFGALDLFDEVSFDIKRGEHVAIIGDNGTGKTTLLKILNQALPPDDGSFTLGAKVKIGYYDQEHHLLHNDKTIFEELVDTYPQLGNTKIRNTLGAFQFTGDEVFKQIGDLSGGERGRVSLAKLMLSESNFLILDEPTNHLDITSKEILEQALNRYTGTILYVSHDRYFINQTAHRILELTHHTFIDYKGDYDYYLEKREHLTNLYRTNKHGAIGIANVSENEESQAKLSWQEQKEQQARERKRQNDLRRTEDRIHELEEKIDEIDYQLMLEDVYSDPIKCEELILQKNQFDQELHALYEIWEKLT